MLRWTTGLLAIGLGINGLIQASIPFTWYNLVPGVIATGAYNPHFVRDIGMAYLVSAAGMGWWALRPGIAWPALVGAAGFLSLHSAVHLLDAACGRSLLADLFRDLPGVFLPAIITCWAALAHVPKRGG
ncbi:MAG: hypothetical protein CFE28_08295 [Alphaproteobacteria bacterium PA2]|nr:MAG: hypothetical protein CFE28_08295 [Alphaproteobacteria bacterium PA2]